MARTPSIYLAGPIEHEPTGGADWRNEAFALVQDSFTRRGWVLVSLIDPTHYDGSADGLTPFEIVTRDRYLLRKADGVIFDARSKSAGWGTAIELKDAWDLGKPTVGFGAPEKVSAFLRYYVTKLVPTVEEALAYMTELLTKDDND